MIASTSSSLPSSSTTNTVPTTPFPNPTNMESLRHMSVLVNRYVYHFRNGDRAQVSFRRVQDFRKELTRLLVDIQSVIDLESKLGKVSGKAKLTMLEKERTHFQGRVELWSETKVDKWFIAFTQLARGSNVAKGLFLLAILADIARMLGISGTGGLLEQLPRGEANGYYSQLGLEV